MRSRLALAFALLALAALAWLLLRTREQGTRLDARGLPASERPGAGLGAGSVRESGVAGTVAPGLRQTHADEVRFEPLPEAPSELVVHVVDSVEHQPVPGAEAYVLEVGAWDWPKVRADQPTPDVEALLCAGGRRLESDVKGELHLPIPRQWLALMARTDKLFGEMSLDVDSAPDATLTLHPSAACLVRTRDPAGRAVAGVPVELGYASNSDTFRGTSDLAGELRVPHLAWFLQRGFDGEKAWFASVADASSAPCVRWFQSGAPLPEAIELEVGEMQSLLLHVAAIDGTPVPVHGFVTPWPRSWSGSASVMRARAPVSASVALVQGEARIARAQPGGWLDPQVDLAGGQGFSGSLFVPELGAAAGEATLRMPGKLQVVLARPQDDKGAPLATQEFQWASWAEFPGDPDTEDTQSGTVRSDERGLLALVVAREDLHPEEDLEPDARLPKLAWRGVLRARIGGLELESAPILYASLGRAAVCDLGALALRPARPLVRGRVVDERGRPLCQVRIDVEQVATIDGEERFGSITDVSSYESARTGSDGSFAVYGSCSSARLFVDAVCNGYSMPREGGQGYCECGAELVLTLVRDGAIRASLRAPHGVGRTLIWDVRLGEMGKGFGEPPGPDSGLRVRDFSGLLPGNYRVQLQQEDSDGPPLLDVENVEVRPGELTLDPRLSEIELTGLPAFTPSAAKEPGSRPLVVLQFRDAQGRPIPDGSVFRRYSGSWEGHVARVDWHGGELLADAEMQRSELTVWSPGCRAWIGECPKNSTELRLETAWTVRLRVEIPPALRKADRRFLVEPRLKTSAWALDELIRGMNPAVVGSDGLVEFECPAECDLEFELQAFALDANGLIVREDTELASVTTIVLHVPAGDSAHPLRATAEEWAAAEKALARAR